MIATRFNPLGIRPKTPAMQYVQDGLVAHWDGVENVGYGLHNANSTTWKDLVGRFGVDFNILTSIWEADCLRCDNRETICTPRTQAFFDATKDAYTAEFTFRFPTENLTSGCAFGFGFYTQTVATVYNAQNIFYLWSSLFGGMGVSISQGSTYINSSVIGASSWAGQKISIVIASDIINQESRIYVNGVRRATKTSAAMLGIDSPAHASMGINNNGRTDWEKNPMPPGGKYFNAKIYGRALTEEEVAHNFAINKERFGL